MKHPPNVALAERALAQFLEALGVDLEQPALAGTPERVVEAYLNDLLAGEKVDIEQLIERGSFPSEAQGLVVVRAIKTMTVCPHHLLPAQGQATVAYLPGARTLGLGTVAHLVDACSRRLTLQEQIGKEVTQALMRCAGARGAYCAMRLEHACLRLRGARQPCSVVETVHVEGELNAAPYAGQLATVLACGRSGSGATGTEEPA
jgi:GTP cyclohydrolase IA